MIPLQRCRQKFLRKLQTYIKPYIDHVISVLEENPNYAGSIPSDHLRIRPDLAKATVLAHEKHLAMSYDLERLDGDNDPDSGYNDYGDSHYDSRNHSSVDMLSDIDRMQPEVRPLLNDEFLQNVMNTVRKDIARSPWLWEGIPDGWEDEIGTKYMADSIHDYIDEAGGFPSILENQEYYGATKEKIDMFLPEMDKKRLAEQIMRITEKYRS